MEHSLILLADSGSTKTDWLLTTENQQPVTRIQTQGINPFMQTDTEIAASLHTAHEQLVAWNAPTQIYFYGAGCRDEQCQRMREHLQQEWQETNLIEVGSDLLGAAKALFGRGKEATQPSDGIACILGTGSNSCFYDGKIVVKNVRAGGYILGDEGSGAVLGKMFLSDVLKGLAPKDVMADFFEKFRISPNEVMESVYNRPFPNRFLSTISYFLADYTNDDYVFNLITSNLRNFFTRNVCQYDYKNYPIRFVGSLANSYATILREVAGEFGIELDVIEETPMNGLIEFHALNIEEP